MKLPTALVATAFLISAPALFANEITIYGTGMGPGGVLADGAVDIHYTLSSTDPDFPGPAAFVTNQDALALAWIADSAISKWISPTAFGTDGHPSVEYDYTTTFDLTGLDASTAILQGMISADDGTTIFLNGNPVSPLFGTYTSSAPFQINSGFVSGLNTLTFAVQNYGGGPTGLNVAISGAAAPTPEPSSVALLGAGLAFAFTLFRRRLAK
ncbi:MAG TPA: PEP-CTERM sorting domain-containing protein [Bryobacteraceae bacterium]